MGDLLFISATSFAAAAFACSAARSEVCNETLLDRKKEKRKSDRNKHIAFPHRCLASIPYVSILKFRADNMLSPPTILITLPSLGRAFSSCRVLCIFYAQQHQLNTLPAPRPAASCKCTCTSMWQDCRWAGGRREREREGQSSYSWDQLMGFLLSRRNAAKWQTFQCT